MRRILGFGWVIVLLVLISCKPQPAVNPNLSPTPYVFGLDLPRGLVFDADGNLFVTEAGTRNGESFTNHSGRVIRVTPTLEASVIADNLPFAFLPALGTGVGVTDIAVVDKSLYILTGEGPDPLARAVLKIQPGQGLFPVANILNFAAKGLTSDLILSGVVRANPYAIVAAPDGKAFYVADGASGRVLQIKLDGSIRVFAELPDSQPLAGLTFGPDGQLYFTAFSPLPHSTGSGSLWAVDSAGQTILVKSGLTMPIDVGFDLSGALYVLEFGNGREPQNPYAVGVGRLIRIEEDHTQTLILDHLNYPTAMAFSQSGDLFIVVGGAFTEARQGSVIKVPCQMFSTVCRA